MRKRLCYMHVGTGKTGTSAIQYALTKAHDYLVKCGFLYPDLSGNFKAVLDRKPTAGNGGVVVKTMRQKHGEQAIRLLRPFSDRPENLVLSCEGFANQSLPRLRRLVQDLDSLGYDVRCLVFFRPQAEMIVSSFLQHVKTDKAGETTLDDHAERQFRSSSMDKRWDWYARAQKLDAAFGDKNVTVKWYPSVIRHDSKGVVNATFEWMGVTLPDDDSADYNKIINPTPGREALMILEQLNSQRLGGKNFSDKFLMRAHQAGLLGRKVTLNPALLQKVESATRDSNIQLLERYCPELSVHDELRSPSKEKQAEVIDPKNVDKLMRIASDILQSGIQTPVRHGDKQMKVTELIEQMRQTNPSLLEGIAEDKAAELIAQVFKHIDDTLAETERGVVKYAGLGQFRVRKVEREAEGEKIIRTQIIFRRAEAGDGMGKGKGGRGKDKEGRRRRKGRGKGRDTGKTDDGDGTEAQG